LVEGQICKVLEKKRHWLDGSTNNSGIEDLGLEFTYQDSGIIYYYRFGQFFKLYDFTANPNDYWEVAGFDQSLFLDTCDSLGEINVDSIGTTVINSETLKYIYVSRRANSYWSIYGKVVERIGAFDYMFPEAYGCILDANEGGALRCYYDSTFGLFETGLASTCDYVVSVEQHDLNCSLNVYPNPTADLLTIEFNHSISSPFQINIYSLLNQKIISKQIQSQLTGIEMNNLRDGLYFIEVTDGRNKVWTKQIIKNAP